VTRAVTEKRRVEEELQNALKEVVSRLGLEPRALALKGLIDLLRLGAMGREARIGRPAAAVSINRPRLSVI
jgi:hypothetical protein